MSRDMGDTADMRIPVFYSPEDDCADGSAAFLVEGARDAPPGAYAVRFALAFPRHVPGCACCAPRGAVAAALSQMFRARATGAAPFFRAVRVLASPAGEAAVREAVAADVVLRARYKV